MHKYDEQLPQEPSHRNSPDQEDEAPIHPYFVNEEQFEDLEISCLPATLSWASYSANNWALDLAARAVDPSGWMGEEQRKSSHADDLTRALLIADCCRPLEADEIGIDPAKYGGVMSRGIWSHGYLARAVVCVESRPESGKVLHFCIRGTDFGNHTNKAVALVRGVLGYFGWTYLRIEKHAFGFEPLAKALSAYASDPGNGISEVILSGHSLGGATAQSLMPSFADCDVAVNLITFGSPGSGSGWLGLISYFNRVTRKALRDSLYFAGRVSASFPTLNKWFNKAGDYFVNPLPKKMGKRIHYKHPNDPVGKYAPIFYRRTGTVIIALSSREIPTTSEGAYNLNIVGIGAHACSKYFERIHDMLERAREDMAPSSPPSLARQRLIQARERGCELEASTVPERMNARVALARQANRRSLKGLRNTEDAIKRLSMLPAPADSAFRIRRGRKLRKLTASLTKTDNW
jgi:hypothetical protein